MGLPRAAVGCEGTEPRVDWGGRGPDPVGRGLREVAVRTVADEVVAGRRHSPRVAPAVGSARCDVAHERTVSGHDGVVGYHYSQRARVFTDATTADPGPGGAGRGVVGDGAARGGVRNLDNPALKIDTASGGAAAPFENDPAVVLSRTVLQSSRVVLDCSLKIPTPVLSPRITLWAIVSEPLGISPPSMVSVEPSSTPAPSARTNETPTPRPFWMVPPGG